MSAPDYVTRFASMTRRAVSLEPVKTPGEVINDAVAAMYEEHE